MRRSKYNIDSYKKINTKYTSKNFGNDIKEQIKNLHPTELHEQQSTFTNVLKFLQSVCKFFIRNQSKH